MKNDNHGETNVIKNHAFQMNVILDSLRDEEEKEIVRDEIAHDHALDQMIGVTIIDND